MRKLAPVPVALAVAAVLAVAADANPTSPAAQAAKGGRLQAFGSCGQLLGYVKGHTLPLVGAWGLQGHPVVGAPGTATVAAGTSAPVRAGAETAQNAGSDYSTTNVQEEGVDEPDLVKSDGSTLFTVASGTLHAVDARSRRPRLLGSLALDQGHSHELLLHGKRLLVLSHAGGAVQPAVGLGRSVPFYGDAGTTLAEVDVTDPEKMRVVRTLKLDAMYLSARLVDGSARVVVSSSMPRSVEFRAPKSSDPQAAAAAVEANRAALSASPLSSWLPSYTLENKRTRATKKRALVQCRHVRRPAKFSGVGLLTVLTIDLAKGLEPVDSDAVVADGRIVYASQQGLYVATEAWAARPLANRRTAGSEPQATAIHKFDIESRTKTQYRGSGTVAGYLLNQWSLSEHKGVLRVASTTFPAWWGGAGEPQRESESFVTTLREQAGQLSALGRVGELGRGERIYAVRFMGDVGYVVTFRQVDPLYTLDLADPGKPRVLGELKIAGYSAYLHPIGEDLLLGVGQDATEQGRVLGTQLAIFDVSDLRRPTRLHKFTISRGQSEAEYDHHAFLYWPATRLVVVPLASHDWETGRPPFTGAVGFRVGRQAGIDKLGEVTHRTSAAKTSSPWPGGAPIRRSLVVGDSLFTVSDLGVRSSALRTLADEGWVAFPAREPS